jgi:nitrile hydratase
MFALASATRGWGKWNIDQSRHAREAMPPADYIASSYYEIWLYGYIELLVESGLVGRDELDAGKADPGRSMPPDVRPVTVDQVDDIVRAGSSTRIGADIAPEFAVGDLVLAKKANPIGHTRLPRYVRGRQGVIARDHGVFVFPDTNAHGLGPSPQHVYSVRFAARELWGPEAAAKDAVHVDLWDNHLERV